MSDLFIALYLDEDVNVLVPDCRRAILISGGGKMTQMIPVSDELYAKLSQAAVGTGQPLDTLIADMLTRGLRQPSQMSSGFTFEHADPILAVMRANGHLVSPAEYASSLANIPPAGSGEQEALLEEIGIELSDALDTLGLSVADLVAR